ncbi:hypothetical protein [Roseovarius dicentrarchi]|uniref:hypothetical protein n=1 Tax=Roseovarius dicentrarchi TaxID=2250573 RepID=UPI001EF06BE9|nr:hypothetical protein [Roseovarius dicentrarchi]
MIAQLCSALARAIIVAVLVTLPSLMLTSGAQDSSQIVILIGFVAGLLIFVEYTAHSPSILEFRFAAPYNRIKFSCIALSVLSLSLIARAGTDPSSLSVLLADIGRAARAALDFPYSPVRSVILLVPPHTPPGLAEFVGIAAAVCYSISLIMLALFVLIVRFLGWPVRRGAFNVWMNLPLFDPTGGADVVQKLNKEAVINVSLGIVLPFLAPALVSVLAGVLESGRMLDPKTLIWIICAWAFIPASLVMRGIAMHRVAELITAKRRRAYAKAEDALQTV